MQTKTEEDVLDADMLLRRAGVAVGSIVADCGVGREAAFTMCAAQLVGPGGTVYALDIVKDILDIVREKAHDAKRDNITTVWTDLEMYGAARAVRDNSVDVAILANTLFQSTNHEPMVMECARMVKLGGKILVVDWVKDFATPFGPDPEQRLAPDDIIPLAEKLGLHVLDKFTAGEYHWGVLLEKPLPTRA